MCYKSAVCKSRQFKFDYVINWRQSSCSSRGSNGEKRDLSVTRARQLRTPCSLERCYLAMLCSGELP